MSKFNPILNFKKNDEYYTPKYLVEPILEFINPKLKIWCPFDTTKSEFVKTFKENFKLSNMYSEDMKIVKEPVQLSLFGDFK